MSEATSTGLYAQMELAPGTLLAGRFRIESLLGVGGMGVVYRALDEALGVPVAIKLVRPELATRPDAFERFRQELLLARQVSSPHVVRIHDIARHEFSAGDARWFISMDLIDGEPLDRRLDRGALPPDEAIAIARQLALGLQAAHARDVIHRDLKPANVLIDAAGTAYITDFGVARSLAGSTRSATSSIVGTPDYISPEQARGDPVGPRSDLYALGLILHEMLTGERAFPASTAAEAIAQRMVRSPPLVSTIRSDVPAWVARLVERLLRPQPSHRLPDAAAVVDAIDRRALPRDPRRRVTLPAVVAVALLLAGIAGTFEWSRLHSSRVVAPAPSQPLDRLLLMPLIAPALPVAQRVGLEMQLRALLADTPGLAVVDADRTLQALRQLDSAGAPSIEAMRTAGAATRVVQLQLVQSPAGWLAKADAMDGSRHAVVAGPVSPNAGLALQRWLASVPARNALRAATLAPFAPAADNVIALQGAAEIARRDGHLDAALAMLREATTAGSSDTAGWLQLSEVATAIGEEDMALNAIQSAQRVAPASAARLQQRLRATRALMEGDARTSALQWRALLAQTPSDTWAELQLARSLGSAGDFTAALSTLQHLTGRDAQDARAWFELGKLSILKGDARIAVDDYLLRSLVLFKRSRNAYGEAEAVNALGVGYGRLGQTADAEEQYRHAVVLRRGVGNRRGVATSLRNLANLLSQRGAFAEAAQALEEARVLHVALGDRAGLAAVDDERGLLFEERGDYRSALDAFRAALKGWEAAGDPHGQAQALNDIGFAHYQLSAYQDAQSYWQSASQAYQQLDDRTGLIRTSQNLGLLDAARGHWGDAARRQHAALEQARAQQMTEEAAVGYRNLAEIALMRGDIATCLAQADQALALFRQRDDHRGAVDVSLIRIDALIDAANPAEAARESTALQADLARASSEQRALAGSLAAELATLRGDMRAAREALRLATPLSQASGVRQLQLQLELERVRIDGRDVSALDAPTATLGHAVLRMQWLQAAMETALASRQAGHAAMLYREAAVLARGTNSPLAVRIHALGAQALRATGDVAGAENANGESQRAQASLMASIPTTLRAAPAVPRNTAP